MSRISPWIEKYANLIPNRNPVLDLACGSGRHSFFLAAMGHDVVAIDINTEAIGKHSIPHNLHIKEWDLEGRTWPFPKEKFSGIVVVNYLWRPLFPQMLFSLEAGGIMIYETFAEGNEKYGRPKNPEYLLAADELKQACSQTDILHYQHGFVETPDPAVKQYIVARKKG